MSKKTRRKYRTNDATGRSGPSQFASIDYDFLRSAAWRSLGGAAAKVWLELRARYNSKNNGHLSLGLAEGADLLGMSKSTVDRALKELETKGFLVMTRRGQWYGRLATTWRLTSLPCDGEPPSRDWQRWSPSPPSPKSKPKDKARETATNRVDRGPAKSSSGETPQVSVATSLNGKWLGSLVQGIAETAGQVVEQPTPSAPLEDAEFLGEP